MRTALALLAVVATTADCQYEPHQYQQTAQQAAILSDARYLAGDGTFGAAYSQEDGVEFKEESDVNGDRRGSYSYVDPTGQRRTVTYTAGKNGFQATGDHIPTAPSPAPPQPEYVPLPRYNPPDYEPPSYAPEIRQQYQRYEHHQRQQERAYESQAVYAQPVPEPQYQQPRYRPEAAYPAPPPELRSIPSYNHPVAPRYQSAPASPYNAITTPAPRRFYPPGKLSFNRTPDGFSYSFSKS